MVMSLILTCHIVYAQKTFVHPGGLHTQADLNRMRDSVAAGKTPWIQSWNKLLSDAYSQSTRTARPFSNIGGSGNRQRAGEDAYAVYLNALRWHIAGTTANADCAVSILNAWANTCNEASGELFQIPIHSMVNAAELMRNYSGWGAADRQKFTDLVRNVFYPACWSFLNGCSHQSWSAPALDAVIACAVFLDDETIFNQAISYYKTGSGRNYAEGSIGGVVMNEDGQLPEMGRDQSHCAISTAALAQVCEIAWNQGVDLYSYADNRLLKGFEYFIKYQLGHPVQWTPYLWCGSPSGYSWFHPSTHDNAYRTNNSPTYELIYNHYVVRQGLSAPYTTKLVNLNRPEEGEVGYYGYGTLTYTLNSASSPYPALLTPPAPTNPKAVSGLKCINLRWTAPENDVARGYKIYRAQAPSGSYIELTSWDNNTRTWYRDEAVNPGTIYYYMIKATNQSGVSIASDTVSASANAGSTTLPLGWGYTDVGSVAIQGKAVYTNVGNNTYAVSGGGTDIGGTADGHGYAFTKVSGDAVISARMYNVDWANGGNKVGLVIRETLNANSKRLTLNLGDRYSRLGVRTTEGGNTTWINGNDFTYVPIWFKIERSGNVFSVFQSMDSINWYKFATQTVAMSSDYYVGLSASAGTSSAVLATAYFDNVKVVNPGGTIPTIPATFQKETTGSTGAKLIWSVSAKASTYILKRSESENGPFVNIATVTGNSYTDSNLLPDKNYYYVLKSANLHGESSDSLKIIVKTDSLSLPSAPTGLSISKGNMYTYLKWNASDQLTQYYNIKRSSAMSGTYEIIDTTATTLYTDINVHNDSTYYYVISAVNALGEGGNSSQVSATPRLGYSYYWPLNDSSGTTSTDVWNNQTLTASGTWSTGKFNNSILLNSKSNYLTLPANITNNLSEYTISVWIYLNSADQWARIFDFGSSTSNNMFLTVKDNNGYIRYAIKPAGVSTETQITTTKALSTSQWVHLALVQKGTLGILYVNGEEVGRNATLNYNPTSLGNTTTNYFGKSQYSSDPYLKARLDEIRIYDTALEPQQISILYKAEPQNISMEAISEKDINNNLFAPIVSASSSLPVLLASSNAAIASIDGGNVLLKSTGTVSIIASQRGNLKYTAALPVTQSLVVHETSSGIMNNNLSMFSLTPNPASDYVTFNNNTQIFVRLYSMAGILQQSSTIEAGAKLYVGNLSPGCYFVKITCNGKTQTTKLIVI